MIVSIQHFDWFIAMKGEYFRFSIDHGVRGGRGKSRACCVESSTPRKLPFEPAQLVTISLVNRDWVYSMATMSLQFSRCRHSWIQLRRTSSRSIIESVIVVVQSMIRLDSFLGSLMQILNCSAIRYRLSWILRIYSPEEFTAGAFIEEWILRWGGGGVFYLRERLSWRGRELREMDVYRALPPLRWIVSRSMDWWWNNTLIVCEDARPALLKQQLVDE